MCVLYEGHTLLNYSTVCYVRKEPFVDNLGVKERLLTSNIFHALTLSERNKAIQQIQKPSVESPVERYAEIQSRATYEKVLLKCKANSLAEDYFAMAFYQGNDEAINTRLVSFVGSQEWLCFFSDALEQYRQLSTATINHIDNMYQCDITFSIHFLLSYAKAELLKHIEQLDAISTSGIVVEKIVEQISRSCIQIYAKTVIYEYYLNIPKYEGKNKLSRYIANTFSNVDEIISFYQKYPVILRRVSQKVLNMLQYYKEMFTNLNTGYSELTEKELVIDGVVTDIACSEGDTHEKGKAVAILNFNGKYLVYKPRNLFITKQYYHFINEINKKFDLPKLPIIKSIWKDTYTIEEKIPYKPCNNIEEIKLYYTRIGYYIAILYLLNGNDIHYENIIANGAYPYLIDMETLFSHNFEQFKKSGTVYEIAVKVINQSVRGTHLLPSYIHDKDLNHKVDISGLGGQHSKLPGQRLVITNWGTDNIRFEMKDVFLDDTNNIPTYNNSRVDYKRYTTEIVIGFCEFMRLVQQNKSFFSQQVERFSGLMTRQVLRATSDYGYMLQFASHPNYTTDMIRFERFLESVWNLPFQNSFVNSCEEEELLNDDIPVFYCCSSGVDVIGGTGKVIDSFYFHDGVSSAISRIEKLSQEEIELQLSHIYSSFGLLGKWKLSEYRKLIDLYRFQEKTGEFTPSETIFQNKIIEVLKAKAISCDTKAEITWLDAHSSDSISYLPVDFANGSSGVLLYLLLTYKESNDNHTLYQLIEGVVNALLTEKSPQLFRLPISGITGWASVLYPLYEYLERFHNEAILQLISNILNWCETRLTNADERVDAEDFASAIIALTTIYEEHGDFRCLHIANSMAERVLQIGAYYFIGGAAWQIQHLSYALELLNLKLNRDDIAHFIETISRSTIEDSGTFWERINIMKYQLLRICDCKQKLENVSFEKVLGLVDVSQLEENNIVLPMLDLLLLSNKCGIIYSEEQQSIYIEKTKTLFQIFEPVIVSDKYSTLALGIGLQSPLCGIGIRKALMDEKCKSFCYRLL